MVFLHGRKARDAAERLVIVYADVYSGRPYSDERKLQPEEQLFQISWYARSMGLASWKRSFHQSMEQEGSINDTTGFDIGVAKQFRLFNGQPDPADPSRFTIAYEVDGQRGTIEGRLDSEDKIKLRIMDGPAKPFNPDE